MKALELWLESSRRAAQRKRGWAKGMLRAGALLSCLFLAVVGCGKQEAGTEQQPSPIRELHIRSQFLTKKPWEYPELAPTRELLEATALAIEHRRMLDPRHEIFPQGFFEDAERGVVYIGFNRIRPVVGEAPTGSRYFIPDFYLVYVYDPSTKSLRGYFGIGLA